MTERDMTRRGWLAVAARTLAGGTALAALGVLARSEDAFAVKPTKLVVYKDPDCGCCRDWVQHLRANGFAPEAHDRSDMDALKDSLGVPKALRSCHTAVAGRYVIEGHVPAADIKRLLATAPRQIVGLAVPGMPMGSPGMDVPGRKPDHYDVIAFSGTAATHVFAKH